jgi:D-beta-D-heptose 7-phosphate kinase/D-beta-D-heptose 1-phosphate adenosyltransferase
MIVVGDIMCDHYVWGDVERISPEAPVQVLRWEREADRPGGAANAAMNLAALGCRVHLVGVVGKDEPGHWLMRTLRASRIDTSGIVESPDRATTLKTRVIARGQHMLRIDRETRAAVSPRDERPMIAAIKRLRGMTAGVVCSDYNKGVLSDAVLAATLGDSRRAFCVVDPKGRDFSRYLGANLLTPNEKELMEAAADNDPRIHGDEVVSRRAETLIRRMKFPALLVTRGGNGMDLFEAEKRTIRRTHIPALQRHDVFDVTGAGDTVAAVVAMGRSAGMMLADAARLANAAAGIVVGMVGTAVADAATLARVIDGEATQAGSKVLPRKLLAARLADARAHGAAVVFTSGPFDSFNVKDLQRLQRARAQGDILVVGVSDDSPAGSQRAEMLAALRFVDFVTLFSEPTAARVIRELRPDIII